MRVNQNYLKDKAIVYSQVITQNTAKKIVQEANPKGVNMDNIDQFLEEMEPLPMGDGKTSEAPGRDFKMGGAGFGLGNIDFTADAITLFQYKRDGRTHQIRALLDYLNVQYMAMEVNPYSKFELINCPAEYRSAPLIRVDNSQKRTEARAQIAAALISLLPENLRHQLYGADLPQVVERVKFMLAKFDPVKQEQMKKKLDSYLSQLDPDYGVQYFTRDNLGGLVDYLRQAKKLVGHRFISEKALDRCQWINKKYRPMLFLNTCKSFSRTCELASYTAKIHNWPPHKQEALHTWISLYLRFMMKYRLRRQLNVKGFVKHDLYDQVDEWIESFEGNRFHGGATPDIADVMFYGATVAYDGLDVWKEIESKTNLTPWLLRMKEEVGDSACKLEMAV